jgi:hypothetical protein
MIWPFHHKAQARYWFKAFALYALVEASVQLLFYFILNTFGDHRISNIEFHLIMWIFQCVLIGPIWFVAWSVSRQKIYIQVIVNLLFYLVYTYFWFGPVQQLIEYLHQNLQLITRAPGRRMRSVVDEPNSFTYLNYQLLKHGFRLSWFFLANYFYRYKLEEQKRLELAVANKDLQLRLLKWHLNPAFYFKTIGHLREVAIERPLNCTGPILQLAKVMEYVIYEAKEKHIDVKKEINFLGNYVQLINQQPGNNSGFTFTTTGDYEKLKIAPLLLAGFIDKINTNKTMPGSCSMKLHFSGSDMQCVVKYESDTPSATLLEDNDPLYRRLTELYPDRFKFEHQPGNGELNLRLKLDEER